jgi:hypothetical protein
MADSILSSIFSKASLSIVKTGETTNEADGLQVVAVNIHYRARAMRHMREDGTSIVDAKVIDPAIAELDVICPTLDSINKVNTALMNRANTYTLTSKGIQLNDTVAERFDVRQTPEMISASPVRITFKQLRRQGGATGGKVVEQPADSSTFGRGIQALSAVTTPVDNAFARVIGTPLPPL